MAPKWRIDGVFWTYELKKWGQVFTRVGLLVDFYRKPPNVSTFWWAYSWAGGGAYIRTRFCVSNIKHLLTLFQLPVTQG